MENLVAPTLSYKNDCFHLDVPSSYKHWNDVVNFYDDDETQVNTINKVHNNIKVIYPDTYMSQFDLITLDWYEDFVIDEEANNKMAYRASYVRTLSEPWRVIENNENFFGYQWQTGRISEGDHKCVFINDGTGLGKTRSALACLENNFRLGPNLIICPKIAMDVWADEIQKVYPYADYIKIEGNQAERRLRLQHVEDVDFTIISYDLLIKHISCRHWPKSKRLPAGELDQYQWNAVIADESHRIKNPKALRSRCAWTASVNATRRIALSATPITVDPQDLWSQWRFLSPKEFTSQSKFRERFLNCVKGWHGGIDCLGWKELGEDHFNQLPGWRTTRRTFESVEVRNALKHMTVPEEGPLSVRMLDMGGVQEKAYDQMKEDLIISLQDWDGLVVAKNHLDKFIKLRQVASGMPVTDDEGKVVGMTHPSNKCEALKGIVEDADCNIVIFTEHSKVAGMIYRYLESKVPDIMLTIITGDTRSATRQAYIKDFQDNDNPKRILVCTSGTMSESVSLTNAGLLVFAQEPASMQQFVQCRGRVRRIGSNVVVPAISLRSKGTVEEQLAGKMSTKLEFLREYLVDMRDSYASN